jgi:hypothetical protein
MKSIGRLVALFATAFAMSWMMTGCEDGGSGGNHNNPDTNTVASLHDARVVGTWNVVSDWRWSQITFNADGTRSVVDRASGNTYNRGSWSTVNERLILVSDVTESCPYTVTPTTLSFTLPSDNVVQAVR